MNSGSREFDFNTMADMGKQVSENKKALDDVRSSFVGPTQEEDAPEPTPVVLDGPATEEGDDNKVNLNELAYAAKRRMEEEGHPAADILLTPNNVKKLADFETKARRVEKERLAYEADPDNYDLNSANALDAYTKSWNLKHLSPEQLHPGPSTWKPGAADEAAPTPVDKEVPRVAPDRGNSVSVDGGSSSGGEAPAPRRQSAGGTERPAPAGKVSESKPPAVAPTKGPSKTNNGITTGPNPPATTRPLSREANEIRAKAKVSARELNNLSPEERTEFNQTGISPLNGEEWDQAAYNGPVKSAEEMRQILASRKQLEKEGQVGSPEFIASIVPPLLGAAGMYGMSKAGPKINKAGQRLGAGIETVKAMTNRPASKPAVNNNISRVAKPPGLQEGFTPTRPAAKAAPTPRIPPSQEPSGSSRVSGRSKPKPPAQQAREMRDDKTPSTSKAKLAKVEKELKTPKKPKKG